MSIDVLCIGHAAYDLSVFLDGYPTEDSKCETDELAQACGGPASNAAYLLSKWHVPCAFAGLVGDDDYGRRIVQAFESVGTDTSLIEIRSGYVTPLSMILVNERNGSRTIINRTRKSTPLQIRNDKWTRFAPKVLLFDGHALEASVEALNAYPEAQSILDAGSWRDGTATLASKVDFLAASERFALQATGLPDIRTDRNRRRCVDDMRDKFGTTTIVTMGEHGLIADDGTGYLHQPAFPAETVDSTAAGDIFHGAFAFGLHQSMPFHENLRFAAKTAALSVQVRGGRPSIPSLERVRRFTPPAH